jgi:hypothetical protein
MGEVAEIDPAQRARRTLAYFLEYCTVEERMQLLKLLETQSFQAGQIAGMRIAQEINARNGVGQ